MTTYTVTWHARGLGRRTRKTFRSRSGALGWWAWLMVRDQTDAARIESNSRSSKRALIVNFDVTPRWPTRRLRTLVRQEQAIQAEIVRLQNAAIARAARMR